MTRYLFYFLIGLLFSPPLSSAEDGLECAIAVYQQDKTDDSKKLLYADTTQFVQGIAREGYLLAFSIDIVVDRVDSIGSDITVHVITLGNPVNNYSQQFRVEHGLPARIDGISGKDDARYSLVLTPQKFVEIDTSGCSYNHRDGEQFNFDPSAHLNIHYVPQSLADFAWNTVKVIMEDSYTRFKELNMFELPGKYELFLCPCETYTVLWDRRFKMMVDPTKGSVFSVHSHQNISTDPFLLWHISVLRNHGYSPLFLSEGYANYLSLALFDMKEMLKGGLDVKLDTLLDTYTYLSADPLIADRISATFVKYLINQYKIDRFLRLYKVANDLNLKESIESTYGLSLSELENDWRFYVDTVKIRPEKLYEIGEQADALRNSDQAVRYYHEAFGMAQNMSDSMRGASMLARGNFIVGDYENAVKYQELLVNLDTAVSMTRMTLGGYRMMLGDYENAANDLAIAIRLDSTNQFIRFNYALSLWLGGDEDAAIDEYWKIINIQRDGLAQLESRVLLAGILRERNNQEDQKRSEQLYNDVVGIFSGKVGHTRPNPTQQMWLGIASLGIGDTGTAQERLETALFLETRPFYVGMINLWLGKTSDIRGEHEVASTFYSRVLDGPAAKYHQDEARLLMETPYQ